MSLRTVHVTDAPTYYPRMATPERDIVLDALIEEARSAYAARRPVSAQADVEAREVLPGGNTRTVIYHAPFPLRVARAHGSRIVDVDGHEYVDFLGEYTAGLYGHDDPTIRAAITSALDDGLSFGAHNTYEPKLARALVDRFPALQLVRFTNSGTEANLMAISLARAFTGRSAIAVVHGGYHGGLLYFGGGGSPVNAPYETVVVPYNDSETAGAMIKEAGDRLAAVVVEPVLGSGGCIPGSGAYLHALQDAARAAGSLFVVDEVMTSRLDPAGLAHRLGLAPDLLTLGKYLGGGLSFGAFGGRADVMALFDPRVPGALPHAGTFNNNVLSLAAGLAGMTAVLTDERLNDLNDRGDRMRVRLAGELAGTGWTATGRGSMIALHPVSGPVQSPADLQDADPRLRELLFLGLLERGQYVAQRGFMALSLAITEDEADSFIEAVRQTIDAIASACAEGSDPAPASER